ncbi:MAG: signal peptidase I [Anaerovoracaceae bacterium]|jgi:signal peptidase I
MKVWIKDILIAVIAAIIIMQFIKPTIVKESSMQPTLYENNYIFLSKQSYRFGKPAHGDIIVFHSDLKTVTGKEKLLIKRVIGLPGETIMIKDGKVYINGEELEEPYLLEPITPGFLEETLVPENSLFVMGDNRMNSTDSRDSNVGFVELDEVVGKAVLRLYPFKDIGPIR